MKLFPEQLSQHLAKEIACVYFVSGDEILLVQESCDLIRNAAVKNDIMERECFEIAPGFAWEKFLSAAKNLSLFSEKKLLELRLSSMKLDSMGMRIMEKYLDELPNEDVLLIIAPKLEAGWQKIKWLKSAEEKGIFLQIWPIEARYLPTWIHRRLRQKNLIADAEICQFLAEKFAGNLLALAQEIEKLAMLYNTGKLDLEQVIAAVTNNARYSIFELADHALSGDAKKTVMALENLQAEGIETILILWVFARELRALISIKEKTQKGVAIEKAIQEQHIFAKHLPSIKRALGRHDAQNLQKLIYKAARIDRVIKGVETGDAWRELQQLALNICR